MSDNAGTPPPPPRKEDLTGRDRMAWNVFTSWGGHLVFVVAGFVMPRMIDRHVGQFALGVWDFSWSLVNYFSLAGIGIGSSVNRHVAKCRAEGNIEEMNRSVSSVLAVQLVIALVVLLLTAAAVAAIPTVYAARLGAETANTVWVVGFLGAGLAVQMACDTSRGVLSGVHRWDVYNAVNAGGYAATVVFMILALDAGGGLKSIAAVYFAATVATESLRMFLAKRYCPGLENRLSLASWSHARAMIVFGGKSVVAGLSPLVVGQGCSLLVAAHLGPAALAVFSRPGGLVRNAQTFVNKFGFVLTPTAGSLQGAGQEEEIRNLLIRTTQFSTAMTVPIILFLSLLGDSLLRVWMGAGYVAGPVMGIIAAGSLLPTTQMPVLSILVGLNLHGRTGLAATLTTVVSFLLGALVLGVTGWSLEGAALAMAVPLTLGNGVVILLQACRLLHMPPGRYLRRSFLPPFLWNLPYAAALLGIRHYYAHDPVAAVLAGGGAVLLLLPPYWTGLLGDAQRRKITSRIPGLSGRGLE